MTIFGKNPQLSQPVVGQRCQIEKNGQRHVNQRPKLPQISEDQPEIKFHLSVFWVNESNFTESHS